MTRLDLIIFGATGFTGKYVVQEVINVSKNKNISWGIAGRNKARLKNVIDEMFGKNREDFGGVKMFIADVSDEAGLAEMAKNCRVVLNCCGPFRFYGEAVVKACVNNGASHVDISGEPQYMEEMQLKYHKKAEEAGVYIVGACGVDSIPTDMGAAFLEKEFGGQVNSIETFLEAQLDRNATNQKSASLHYATLESAVHGVASAKELQSIRSQLYSTRLPPLRPQMKTRSLVHKNEVLGKWCIRFPGADQSVMQRSQRFLLEYEKKRPAQIKTFVTFSSLFDALFTCLLGVVFTFMASFSMGRTLLLKYPTFFTAGIISHEGPSEEVAENTLFDITLVGRGWTDVSADPLDNRTDTPNKEMVVRVSGRNPGYGATAIMMVASALTILEESDRMPGRGGVYSPYAAFHKTSLISRIIQRGVLFKIFCKFWHRNANEIFTLWLLFVVCFRSFCLQTSKINMVFYFTSNVVQPPVKLFMGIDKYENEELIKWGWPEDVWFHVDKLSSAHVYLRLHPGQTLDDVPAAIIDEAAQLVKANSIQGNKMNDIDVVYTMWDNLKKTDGMEVGQVSFHRDKEVRKIRVAKRSNEVINRLNKTKKEEHPDFREEREARDRKEREDKKKIQRELKEKEKEEAIRKEKEAELRSYSTLFSSDKMTTNRDGGYDSDDFM